MTALAVSVLPQVFPHGYSVSPQCQTEVLRKLVEKKLEDAIA